ncbi:DUF3284 domain-containing protein [Pseudolactococcus plantarum]|uniref:DUF3284 domain-containing protein n=1 Tax=Pseudolactococcus plantarum TaxID=1365 RepID=A0A2A5S4D6_9LACT|nr:DUF3284 domain-containing protein [Lactococcus plantarum]MDN6069879.1 DUF3284 domain-containing protein [Lactococcus plantarum]MDN6085194.1 DUF3284 domain-containing protein [Lactococcus plantarum]PCS08318.1 hypothetical protein RU87_GL000141 [Lactococcus plantarum]HCN75301.1 DUF3284 domain-containing protein [Lactococcus sp.]
MKITKTIDVPRQFIFDKITESSLYDIKQNTGKTPKISSLTGFEYQKNFGKNQSGKIKFDEVTEPSIYAFTTKTNRNTFKTRWELHKIDDQSTDVVIAEESKSSGMVQNINDTIMAFMFGKLKKRQMLAILDEISKAYNGR